MTVHLATRAACGTSGNDVDRSREQPTAEETQVGEPKAGRGGRGEGVKTSKLNLVDLAGSEKSNVVSSAMAGDAAMLHREGRFINKSLAFLEQVLIVRPGSDRGQLGIVEGSLGEHFTLRLTNFLVASPLTMLIYTTCILRTTFTYVRALCAARFPCRSPSRWPTERGSTSRSDVQNSPTS